MLISMHTSFLNEGKRGESPELDSFLDDQLENQKQWRKELGLTKDEAANAYAFFEWCGLSLILCNHELPDGERALEISSRFNDTRYDVIQRSDRTVTVQPWVFQEREFIVNVEACYLEQMQFSSNDELTEALQTATIKPLKWKFVK